MSEGAPDLSRFPLPDTNWEPTREFWHGAERGELLIPRCDACERYVWYPQPSCPGCAGKGFAWTALSGRGTLFSWALVTRALYQPFADKAPYVTALVALEEAPEVRLVTMIVDCEPDELRIDLPVRAVFRRLEFSGIEGSVAAPLFTPVRGR